MKSLQSRVLANQDMLARWKKQMNAVSAAADIGAATVCHSSISSAASERSFSATGCTVSARRTALSYV